MKKATAELHRGPRAGRAVGGRDRCPGTAAPLVDDLKAAGAAKIYVAESADAENVLITPLRRRARQPVRVGGPGGGAAGRHGRG